VLVRRSVVGDSFSDLWSRAVSSQPRMRIVRLRACSCQRVEPGKGFRCKQNGHSITKEA